MTDPRALINAQAAIDQHQNLMDTLGAALAALKADPDNPLAATGPILAGIGPSNAIEERRRAALLALGPPADVVVRIPREPVEIRRVIVGRTS
jgi:hypothetical protein